MGSRMLVDGSMSSIIMDAMRFLSVRPLSAEKTFRSRIDSAMLVTRRGQSLRSTSNAREFTDLNLFVLVQEDVPAPEGAMIK